MAEEGTDGGALGTDDDDIAHGGTPKTVALLWAVAGAAGTGTHRLCGGMLRCRKHAPRDGTARWPG
ncbi:hypothetical protein [Lysobacter gummosus]|uniref:hypothetical protein n=1 Tax=Lysobacter gummosus TaxID=262324 RepID=UPI0036373A8E